MRFVPNKVSRAVALSVLKSKKSSPKFLFGAGVVGVIGGTVLACRATLRLPEVMDEFQEEVTELKVTGEARVANPADDYNESEFYRDVLYVYAKNSAEVAKLYAPSLIVGTIAIASLTTSHVTLQRRNASLTAAFAGVATAYEEYRNRVRMELGKERELDIYHGVENKVITKPDGTKDIVKVVDPNKWSVYARFFDEASPYWEKDAGVNRLFVQAAQNYFNNRLQVRGYVFLNEVYDHFGFDYTQAGSIVGWMIGAGGDDHIDFGIFEAHNANFVNGYERSILLDFNVDGVIYDKLEKRQ